MVRTRDRYSIELPAAVITEPDGPPSVARIENLSADGLLLKGLPQPVAKESPVWVEIPRARGRGRLGFLGRVRWTSEDSAGVEIEAMLPHHRLRLDGLLTELSTR